MQFTKKVTQKMSHQFQIDQSGKVENTARPTVVAIANSHSKSLRISATEKQKLIQAMRSLDYPVKTFIFKIFSGLIFLLLKDQNISKFIIDQEYPGYNPLIKDIILTLYRKTHLKVPQIDFGLIGKQSNAHRNALQIFQKKTMPDKIVKAEEILKLFYAPKQKIGRSSRSSRDNP